MHLAMGIQSGMPWTGKMSPSRPLEKRCYEPLEETALLEHQNEDFPLPLWIYAIRDKHGRRFPQAIAHRGYKARHPENTMRAFDAAVEGRAHALETDIHLTKDGVVVLSHDADLKRCFGVQKKIIDCDWSELSQLRTLQAPHEPMPRLLDLLNYIAQPGFEHVWLLLDIKLDNNADDVMRLIAATIDSVPPSKSRSWRDRILLGIWAAKFLPRCTHYLPGYPTTHIGFSTCYARKFLAVPNVSFNMLQKVLLGPIGSRFIRDVRDAGRQLFVWTVNDQNSMEWSIQKELDGVITDDPKKFIEVCDDWDEEKKEIHVGFGQWLYTFWLYFVVMGFGLMFRYRFPETVEDFMRRNSPQGRHAGKVSGSTASGGSLGFEALGLDNGVER